MISIRFADKAFRNAPSVTRPQRVCQSSTTELAEQLRTSLLDGLKSPPERCGDHIWRCLSTVAVSSCGKGEGRPRDPVPLLYGGMYNQPRKTTKTRSLGTYVLGWARAPGAETRRFPYHRATRNRRPEHLKAVHRTIFTAGNRLRRNERQFGTGLADEILPVSKSDCLLQTGTTTAGARIPLTVTEASMASALLAPIKLAQRLAGKRR